MKKKQERMFLFFLLALIAIICYNIKVKEGFL